MGVREFTGQLDAPRVREFTGQLDPVDDALSRRGAEPITAQESAVAAPSPRRGTMRAVAPYAADEGQTAAARRDFAATDPRRTDLGESSGQPVSDELGRLRDSFFSGVDSTRAAVSTVGSVAQMNALQQARGRLREMERSGQGESPEADGLRTTIAHYSQRLPQMLANTAEAQADAARGSEMTTTPAMQSMMQAKTFGEAWEAFKQAPYEIISGISAQSLATSLPALVAGAIAGPAAGAATMGLSSGLTEAGSSMADYARDHGIDPTNAKDLQAFYSNPDILASALDYAGKRAGIIGGLDAVSGGMAGRTIAPPLRNQLARQAINMPAQMATQAALGAAGEAGAQVATKGRIDEPGQVLAEAAGEAGGAPAEVIAFGREARRPTEVRKAINDRLDDFAATHGVAPEAVEKIKKRGQTRPLAELSDYYKRAIGVLAQAGIHKGPVDEQALGSLDEPRPDVPRETPAQPSEPTGLADPIDAGELLGTIDEAAHEGATSPLNDRPEPTQAQAAAGNYKMGHVTIGGMGATVENGEGSVRRGVDEDGRSWQTVMRDHYGYWTGTTAYDSTRKKKQGIDVFIKPGTREDYKGPIFVIDQINPKTGAFDEHKTIAGAANEAEAEAIYRRNYSSDWKGFGGVTRLPMPAFKAWAKSNEPQKGPLGDLNGRPGNPAPLAAGADVRPAADLEGSARNLLGVGASEGGRTPAIAAAPVAGSTEVAPVRAGPGEPAGALSNAGAAAETSAGDKARGAGAAETAAPAPAVANPRQKPKPSAASQQRQATPGTDLLRAINRAGGIAPSLLHDLSVRAETNLVDRETGKKRTAWRNPRLDKQQLFRNGGKADLLELAETLEGEGYIEPGLVKRDYKAASEKVIELVRAALQKQEVAREFDPQAIEAEMRRRREMAMGYPDYDAESAREAEAERQAIMAEANLTHPEVAAATTSDVTAGATEPDTAQAMRAMGFDDEDIEHVNEQARLAASEEADRAAQESTAEDHGAAAREAHAPDEAGSGAQGDRPQEGVNNDYQPQDQANRSGGAPVRAHHADDSRNEVVPAAGADAGLSDRVRSARRPQADAEASEGLTLEAQTPADLKAKTEREAAAKKVDEAEQKRLADKAKADAQRDELRLTGSDRAADVAAAAGQGDLKFSIASPAEPFYSELARRVEAADMRAGPLQSWKAWLKGQTQRGVKPDEIEWSGLTDWLELQQGKVTKQQVLDYLNANGVRVEETRLGEDREGRAKQERLEKAEQALVDHLVKNEHFTQSGARDYALDAARDELTDSQERHMSDEASKLVRELRAAYSDRTTDEKNPPKYANYTLPGGTNYREVLLTLPSKPATISVEQLKSGDWVVVENGKVGGNYGDDKTAAEAQAARLRESGMREPGYRSSHWDQPNVLAHIRLNDRTDADGKRVLFVEEIQSDWGQAAKKRGFGEATGPRGWGDTSGGTAGGLPRAPFVGKTDAWVSLAIKRIVKMAVDEGYDRVAFINGEQSADRYDLSKQISKLRWDDATSGGIGDAQLDAGEGHGILYAYNQQGNLAIDRSVNHTELPDLIGKEAAERLLMANPKRARSSGGSGVRRREIAGLDLKVGGKGMHAFYDQIVPKVAKDVVRKLGGDGLMTIDLPRTGEPGVMRKAGTPWPAHMLKKQPGFDITPAMREKAAGGVPLFSVADTGRYNRVIDAIANGTPYVKGQAVSLGRTPDVLRMLGASDVELSIDPGTIVKAMRKPDGSGATAHALSPDTMRSLPEQLHDPVMVFASKTQPDAMVVLTELRNADGKPVIAAIHLEKQRGRVTVNEIASVYDAKLSKIRSFLNDGDTLYAHQTKAPKWATTVGLQLPWVVQSSSGQANPKSERDVAQYRAEAKFSDGDVAGGAGQMDNAARGQLDTSPEAERNIRLLGRDVAPYAGASRVEVDALHPYVARRLGPDSELGAIAAAFGSRLQGFGLNPDLLAADRKRFGFFNGVRTGGIIFLRDSGSDRPHIAVLGHELGHELRTRRPDLYDQLVEAIRPYVDQKKYAEEFVRSAVASKVGGGDRVREEFIGEVLSDGFMDREFWRALGNKNPNLLKQIGDAVMRLVETVLRTVGYRKRSAPYLTDYKRVMQIAGEVMAEFGVAPQTSAETLFQRTDDRHTTEQREALARAGIKGKQTFSDKIRSAWGAMTGVAADREEMAHAFVQGALDQFHGIRQAIKSEVGNLPVEQDPYIAARLANGGTSSVMRGLLLHGQAKWADNGQHLEKIDGTKGLLDILKPLGDDLSDWFGWMIGNRAARLFKEGRENNFTEAQIKALQSLGTPDKIAKFRQAANEYAAFKRSVLDVAEKAGLIDKAGRAAWDNADYVPFYRTIDKKAIFSPTGRKGLAGQSSGIRVLKGGTSALNDPMENLLMNFSRLIDASLKNNAIRKTVETLGKSDVVTKVGYDMRSVIAPQSQVERMLKEAGTPDEVLNVIPPEAFDGMAKMWSIQPPSDPDVVRVMVDGKPQFYRVNDPLLLKALTSFVPFNFPGMGLMRAAKRLLTGAVTATPEFMIRNFIRDSVSAKMIGRDGFNPAKSLVGVVKSFTETGAGEQMLFAGASFQGGHINAADPTGTATSIRRALRAKGMSAALADDFMSTIIDTPAKAWEAYRKVGEAIENANREAVFEAAMQNGKSATAAAYEGKDLLDFNLRGSSPLYQFAADVLPFFNARVQGMYRMGRSDPKRLLAYGALMAMLSVSLALNNAGEDWYEELEDWDKDNYWHFKIFGMHWRIPKPFELGVLFASLPERLMRNMKDLDSTNKTISASWKMIADQLKVFGQGSGQLWWLPTPQLLTPAVNAGTNYDPFRERPIENQGDEGKLPHARYSGSTSAAARALLEKTAPVTDAVGLSPKKLEYLIGGYLGTMGLYGLAAADWAVRKLEGKVDPAGRLDDLPVVKSFYREDPARSTVFESDLYKMRDEVEKIARTIKSYRTAEEDEKADALEAKNEAKLDARKEIARATRKMQRVNKERDEVYADPNMTPAEKRKQLDELQREKNEIAKETTKEVQGAFQ